MTKKLFDFAKGKCAAESADNPMFQEVLLGGHLYQMVLKVVVIFPLAVFVSPVSSRNNFSGVVSIGLESINFLSSIHA